ncbi:cholesterol oxidase-like isoform X2 [Amphiura filiformis]|uniref:cholesterol oxidase-like isoform X2 n=1 Tax=Amphiura filiformis TaxID=82378 RepID=UPI003B20F8DF
METSDERTHSLHAEDTCRSSCHQTSSSSNHHQSQFQPDYENYRLASPITDIKPEYDVIVIGSGYGGGIAASRSARAGQKVCVLERGKEWLPGEFPEKFLDARKEVSVTSHKLKLMKPISGGNPTMLFDLNLSPGVAVLQGSGLGGTSLINANAALLCEPKIFQDPVWPKPLCDDLDFLLEECQQRVNDMLKPSTYPQDYPQPPKMAAFKKVASKLAEIEDLDPCVLLKRAQLYVNFQDMTKNHVGIPQPACIGCGNCCGGCNTGAKNTINMNYLPDAKRHGAQLFTQVEVRAVTRDNETGIWSVHYLHHSNRGDSEEKIVKAKVVILGAGSLGSTGILLRSKERGLPISPEIGRRFNTNGGSIGFSYNGEDEIRPRGVKLNKIRKSGRGPGPCVTTVIDMRNRPGKEIEDSFILEDGTPPSSMGKFFFKSLLGFESLHSGASASKNDKLSKFRRRLGGKSFDNSLTFLVTSSPNDAGQLQLGKDGRVWADFPNAGEGRNYPNIDQHMKKGGETLKGTFIPNPMWNSFVNKVTGMKGMITVHPLGGCPMGPTGVEGVVNHGGQVFVGDSEDVHDGLYVVDGAIIPRSLGANPSLTIAMVAERCMWLLAKQRDWGSIDYSFDE